MILLQNEMAAWNCRNKSSKNQKVFSIIKSSTADTICSINLQTLLLTLPVSNLCGPAVNAVWLLLHQSCVSLFRKILSEKTYPAAAALIHERDLTCSHEVPAHKLKLLFLAVDVKPSNVLINTQGQVKMCDFGISGYLVDSVAKTMDAGCKPYMAVSRKIRKRCQDLVHCAVT